MVDINKLKELISDNDIITLLADLGADYIQENGQQVIFYSICHHPDDPIAHKPKLYYYKQSHSFYCFACGWQGDIIALVQKVKSMQFKDAIAWIMSELGLEEGVVKCNADIDPWQKELKKYLKGYEPEINMPIYDDNVLDLFKPYCHESWLNDGISKSAMNKFGIGWYGRNAQITIPVLDADGKLVGLHGRNTRQSAISRGLKYQPIKTLNAEYKFPTGGVLYGLYQNKQNIVDSKSTILVEAPKSVLLAEDILDNNTVCALFGWHCNAKRRTMLLDLGVEDITIALDRQYVQPSGDEFAIYVNQVKKIAKLFSPYCNVYAVLDKGNMLGYKDSPFDCGRDVWEELYKNRVKIS